MTVTKEMLDGSERKAPAPKKPLLTPFEYEQMISHQITAAATRKTGYLNAYVCQHPFCKKIIITIDRDPGFTPALMICEAPMHGTKTVGKMVFRSKQKIYMDSAGYQVEQYGATEAMAVYEWLRPSYSFYCDMPEGQLRDHVERGGLIMRVIGEIKPVGF